jgi:inosine-uridine nucleoside N-ribohydrolase
MAGTLESVGVFRPDVEFNVEMDVEAAYVFFRDVKTATLLPIETVTLRGRPDETFWDSIKNQDSHISRFLNELYVFENMPLPAPKEYLAYPDPAIVACLIDPSVATETSNRWMTVEVKSPKLRGCIVSLDENDPFNRKDSYGIKVVHTIDLPKF